MKECKLKLFLLFLLGLLLSLWFLAYRFDTNLAEMEYTWGWIDQIVRKEHKDRRTKGILQINETTGNCSLNVAVLRNKKLLLSCGKGM